MAGGRLLSRGFRFVLHSFFGLSDLAEQKKDSTTHTEEMGALD